MKKHSYVYVTRFALKNKIKLTILSELDCISMHHHILLCMCLDQKLQVCFFLEQTTSAWYLGAVG